MPVRPIVFGGTHTLVRQSYAPREMRGAHNADGYGVAWYHEGHPIRIREARPLWHDAELEQLLASVHSNCMFAIVRNASPGIPVDRGEVAPLIYKRWSFALNGYVRKFRSHAMRTLRSTLPDELYGAIQGTSDTETLFMMAITEVWKGASMATALSTVAERAGSLGLRCRLNMVMSDGESIAVSRTSNTEETNSLYVAHRTSLAPGGTLVVSEPLDASGEWEEVPPYSVVELAPGEEPRIAPLGAGRQEGLQAIGASSNGGR